VRGYEPEIIRGAELTIKNEKPILIASFYHTGEEFFPKKIPKLLGFGYQNMNLGS